MANDFSRWRNSFRQFRPVYLAMAIVAVLLIVYLIFGPKPWIDGIGPAEEAGEKLRPENYVASALWWVAWGNLALLAVFTFVAPWLFHKLPDEHPVPPGIGLAGRSRVFLWVGLGLAALLSAWLQAPRLEWSLWGDEEYTAKRFVAGYYRRDDEGAMEHKVPDWVSTAWDFRSGANNHQVFSVLSRLSHSFYSPSDDPEAQYFNERLIRLPSFLASIGTVLAVGWLVALLGAPRGAVVAGFLLAVHPWFIRYGPEARGYALMMLLLTLAVIFLYKAAIGGRARHWLGFAMTQALCFLSYMGSLNFILMLNLVGLLLVLFAQRHKVSRLPQFGRFAGAGLLAAMMVSMVAGPVVLPLKAWYENKVKAGNWGAPPDTEWVVDVLCQLGSGLTWKNWDASNPLAVHLASMPGGLVFSLLGLVAVLVVLGIFRLAGAGRVHALLIPALLLPGPLMVATAVYKQNFLFPWYLLVALPAVVIFAGLGADAVGHLAKSAKSRTALVAGLAVLCLGLLVATSHERISLLRSQSVERLADSVALTRQVINPAHPDIDKEVVTVGFLMWAEAYDPAAVFVKNGEELKAVMQRAKAEGKDLYVNFGQFLLARLNNPDIMAIIEDESQFEQVAVLYGLWQPCTRWVYKAK